MANEASEGMFGFSFIICSAKSLIESIVAVNFLSFFFEKFSFTDSIHAFIYGLSSTIFLILNRFFPCIMIVVLPSGIFKTLKICATVPIL